MWTRSAANKITGLMTVICTDWNGEEFYRGEFADVREADQAGEAAERRMTLARMADNVLDMNMDDRDFDFDISDDELLREILA